MSKRSKLLWAVSLLLLLFTMISVGGVTRLTKSGLSITEWKPITGVLPPLTEAEWTEAFNLYRDSPEFKQHNSHFEIDDYKGIFWWEYIHRLLGRAIFFVALAMSFVFWRKKECSRSYAIFLPLLVAFQGLVGWLMVKTGLNHRPSVSHYMLAIHFFLALSTMTVVYHPIAKMKRPILVNLSQKGRALLGVLGALIVLQIVYGCFTAGLKAGVLFNTFPFMDGQFFPPHGLHLEPALANIFENPVVVQWIHRWLGIGLAIFLLYTSVHLLRRESSAFKGPIIHLASIVIVQVLVGISTLIYMVPIPLAVFHQAMAVLVWLGYCNIMFRIKPGLPAS